MYKRQGLAVLDRMAHAGGLATLGADGHDLAGVDSALGLDDAALLTQMCIRDSFKAAALIAHALRIFCSSAAFLIWIMDD